MFGPKLFIKTKDDGVTLAPFKKEYCPLIAELSSSVDVRMFTGGPFADTIEDEEEMYENMRKNKTSVLWAIFIEGYNNPIGYTAIHNIAYDGHASSEIMIFNKKFWAKGVATQSHIIRTWYAAEHLNRNIIYATVNEENLASKKALQNVGYFQTGNRIRSVYRNGKYYDSAYMTWINPKSVSILYPEGLPKEYEPFIEKAKTAIELGYKEIKLL